MDEKQIGTFSDLKAMQQIPYDLLSHVSLGEIIKPYRNRWGTDAWSLNYEFTERLLKEMHLHLFAPPNPEEYLKARGHNLGRLFCELPERVKKACELEYQAWIMEEAMGARSKRYFQAFEQHISTKYPRKEGNKKIRRGSLLDIFDMFEISTEEANQENSNFRHSLQQYASQHTVGKVFSWMEKQAQRQPTVTDTFPVPLIYLPTGLAGSLEPTHCTQWRLSIGDCLPDKVCETPWQEIDKPTGNQNSLRFIQDYLWSLDKYQDYIALRYEYQLLERPLFQFLLVSDRLWHYYWTKAKMWQGKEGEQML